MKKLLLWLLAGMLATALSISLSSNTAVLFSLCFMVAIPLSFVVNKKRQSLNELESAMDNSALVVIENDRKNSELARREGMRTNAAQLQAELVEIQNIEEQYERVKRMARWKISVGIFNSTYQPMLEKEKRFDDGLSFIDEDYVAVRDR